MASLLSHGSEHAWLVESGWAYRTNTDCGWIMYRDPVTRLWHTRECAKSVMAGRSANYGQLTGDFALESL